MNDPFDCTAKLIFDGSELNIGAYKFIENSKFALPLTVCTVCANEPIQEIS